MKLPTVAQKLILGLAIGVVVMFLVQIGSAEVATEGREGPAASGTSVPF